MLGTIDRSWLGIFGRWRIDRLGLGHAQTSHTDSDPCWCALYGDFTEVGFPQRGGRAQPAGLLVHRFCVRNVCELLCTGCNWKGLGGRDDMVIPS